MDYVLEHPVCADSSPALSLMPHSNITVAGATQADQKTHHRQKSKIVSPNTMVFSICNILPPCTLCFMTTGQADYVKAHAHFFK